jgi:palmitoyltransferase ZDHHC9/14/18
MASSRPGTAKRPGSSKNNPPDDDVPHPQFPQFPPGPPSIISSRMTDIASEDGDHNAEEQTKAPNRRSYLATDSRPGTARTARSGSRGGWSQPPSSRRGNLQRGSLTQSISGSVSSARPISAASKSHVPSLTSHAFFHPMSSQKLQAQRGASRPSNLQQSTTHDAPVYERAASPRLATASPVQRMAHHQSTSMNEHDIHELPPSRGTENTEPETYDRNTANTSPTHGGNYTANSPTESVRPLQRNHPDTQNLRVDVNASQSYNANALTPSRTPRSFRSSFMLSRSGSGAGNSNRNLAGAEKLSSAASSPQLTPTAPASRMDTATTVKDTPKLGRNHEYFEGNTVFCIGGRLQNTRHRPINIATGSFVVIPSILFFVFSAPYLWYHVSPAVPIVFGYVFYICISSFLHASGSDPGVSTHTTQACDHVLDTN